jgi:hypothetical protein
VVAADFDSCGCAAVLAGEQNTTSCFDSIAAICNVKMA